MMDQPSWWRDDLPRECGVYLFRDADGRVLYVGKARSLRERLRSYKNGGDGRVLVRFLTEAARTVETIVTRTEQEALLLEDSLVKTHKPPHNVRLKDDKSFLMLKLDLGEEFPRFRYLRQHNRRLAAQGRVRLFGPFVSSKAVRSTLAELQRLVPMRDCPDSVMRHRTRPCLKHQIGLCSAPCTGEIDKAGYALLVERAVRILSGESRELLEELTGKMREASGRLDYERAAWWRDRLEFLRATAERQAVVSSDETDRDVLALARDGERAIVHRLSFRGGKLFDSRSHVFRSQLDDAELLHGVLTALYAGGRLELPQELVLPLEPADPESLAPIFQGRTSLRCPESGERKRMLDLAFENARAELARDVVSEERTQGELDALTQLAGLDTPPEVIDCFDISNFQGADVVASRVRMRGGVLDRSGYRRFKIRGVHGQDDFASMREVVSRALKRGVEEDDLPDLIVIDGGAAQLAKALEAREEQGAWGVAVIGLAKARVETGRRGAVEERVFLPESREAIVLSRHDPARSMLERIRDEAHRFAITYHRKERGRLSSELDSIPGVGPVRRKALLRAFGSVKGVAQAGEDAIGRVEGIGGELAKVIWGRLHRPKG
jgi:excinuclease ABC subunit C